MTPRAVSLTLLPLFTNKWQRERERREWIDSLSSRVSLPIVSYLHGTKHLSPVFLFRLWGWFLCGWGVWARGNGHGAVHSFLFPSPHTHCTQETRSVGESVCPFAYVMEEKNVENVYFNLSVTLIKFTVFPWKDTSSVHPSLRSKLVLIWTNSKYVSQVLCILCLPKVICLIWITVNSAT